MSILIIFPNWIGDVVMCLPTVEKIIELYPNKKIVSVVRNSIYPLIEENLNKYSVGSITYSGKSLKETYHLIKKLKKYKFEEAFVFPRSYRMFAISLLAGVKNIYGYGNDLVKKFFMKKAIKRDKKILSQHRVYYYLELVKAVKEFDSFSPPKIEISEKYKKWADDLLTYLKVKSPILIGINPGATYGEAKCWKTENFIQLIELLNNNWDCKIFLFGGKDNEDKCNLIRKSIKKNIFNFAGRLSLIETAALIEKMDIFITNDTGPMHVADALGVKIVAIFGPTDVNETPPFRKNGIILYKNLECSPCKKRVCPYGHNRCMELIEVEEVFESVKKLIDTTKNNK